MRSIVFVLILTCAVHADEATIRNINPVVLPADSPGAKTLSNDYKRRIQEANSRESQAWNRVATKADWEAFRDARVASPKHALREFPSKPLPLNLRVTSTISGEGYRIEKLVYETRPGFFATANLYMPAAPLPKMPGLMVIHAHHTPNANSELQDLGIGWARAGCAVIVPELIGHGERRQHAFRTEKDYPKPFRPSRQDYYFRFNSSRQLEVTGDSLMGWFAWDLSRGIDVLLTHAKADPDRIVVLGAVAGGGDPAGVLSAIDPRVSAVVPFNFGGGQPDYATPEDTDKNFYWFGQPHWEATRALRDGARDGFAQWLIVGAAAPKPLVLGHEFAWDSSKDPAWPRLQKVYGFYDAGDKLGFTTGKGSVKGPGGPDNTHCTHIGELHRKGFDPYLAKWFGIPEPRKSDTRHTSEELACWTDALKTELKPRMLHEAAGEEFDRRVDAARQRSRNVEAIRSDWAKHLGNIEPAAKSPMRESPVEDTSLANVHRLAFETDPGVQVPCLLLIPKGKSRTPLVVMVAQAGKAALLKERALEIETLLKSGIAVGLIDVRGTGETRPGDDSRGRNSTLTSIAACESVLGQTLVGSQLKDLRAVLRALSGRSDIDGSHIAIWGDSLAKPNAGDFNPAVPLDADQPTHAEPLGGLLALFAALYEQDLVKAVYVRGGLVNYRSVLGGPYVYVPADALIPGAANAGDLESVAAAIPQPLRLVGMVDGLNRPAQREAVSRVYPKAVLTAGKTPVMWMIEALTP